MFVSIYGDYRQQSEQLAGAKRGGCHPIWLTKITHELFGQSMVVLDNSRNKVHEATCTVMEQPLSAPLNGIAIEFGYYPKPCDIATGRFSVQTLPDYENSVATVVGDPNAFKDWIYPGAQQ